jgi:serine/threonine protein kinase
MGSFPAGSLRNELRSNAQAGGTFGVSAVPQVRPLERSNRIGRYHILRVLGQGGMGVVYEAYDPGLARKVAIKVLQPQFQEIAEPQRREALREKFVIEARNLASLSHPNIVPIYDFGMLDDGTFFLAMELIAGRDLRQILAAKQVNREWALDVVLEAAEGLAAAHAAGLVHLDFKPENIMVSDSGRVVVLDFGLAGKAENSQTGVRSGVEFDAIRGRGPRGDNRDQVRGAGTLPYMSPQQMAGDCVDPHNDLFALGCVLFEVMTGRRPFPGSLIELRLRAIASGELKWPRAVPNWLRRLLGQSMAFDPQMRGPGVASLVDAIRRGLVRKKRRIRYTTTLSMTLVAMVSWIFWMDKDHDAPSQDCIRPGTLMDSIWNERTRDEVRAGFDRTGLPSAAQFWQDAEIKIELWRSEWLDNIGIFCNSEISAANEIVTSPALQAQSRSCFEESRREMESLLEIWRTPTKAQVVNAYAALSSLTPPGTCANVELLTSRSPLPADPYERHQVQQLRAELGEARILAQQGNYEQATNKIESIQNSVLELHDLPLIAFFAREIAQVHYSQSEAQHAAYFPLIRASLLALAAKRDEDSLLFEAKLWFLRVYHESQYEEAEEGFGNQEAAFTRARRSPKLASWLRINRSVWSVMQNRPEEAIRHLKIAEDETRKSLGSSSPQFINVVDNLAWMYDSFGKDELALEYYRQVLDVRRLVWGDAHPNVLDAKSRIATILRKVGNVGVALRTSYSVLSQCESSGMATEICALHMHYAAELAGDAGFFRDFSELSEALAQREREIGHRIEPVHPWRESIRVANLIRRGETDSALHSALIGLERLRGEPHIHPQVTVEALVAAREAALANGNVPLATEFDQELASFPKNRADFDEGIATARSLLDAQAWMAAGRIEKAVGGFESILDELEAKTVYPHIRAQIHLSLAQAYMRGGLYDLAGWHARQGLDLQHGIDGLAEHLDFDFHVVLAQIALEQQDDATAVEQIRLARQVFDESEVLDNRLAPVDFVEAQVLAHEVWSEDAKDMARILAERARQRYTEWDGDVARSNIDAIDHWLARRTFQARRN